MMGVTNAVQSSRDPYRRHRRPFHLRVAGRHGADRLSDQADHPDRSRRLRRADRHGGPPDRGVDEQNPRADRAGRKCRRRQRHDRHGAGVEVRPRRLHHRGLAHRACHSTRAVRQPQIRRRRGLRSPRPHHRRADDAGVEGGFAAQKRHRAAGVDSRQQGQGHLWPCRHRLGLASVHADADEGARTCRSTACPIAAPARR